MAKSAVAEYAQAIRQHIVIELRHAESTRLDKKQPSHKLSLGVPDADVQPPHGIDTYGLEFVHLNLNVRQWQPKLRRKRKLDKVDGQTDSRRSLGEALQLPNVEDDLFPIWNSQENLIEDGFVLAPFADASADDMLLDDTPSSSFDTNADECDDFELLMGTRPQIDHSSTLAQNPGISLDGLLELIDAGLRLTICERPSKLPKGIKSRKPDFSVRLADLAPSLFSPGYMSAVAQRAVFIPTIGHALSHSLYENARSPTLKRKLEELAKASRILENHEQSGLNSEAVQKVAGAKLWQLLQRQVFDPKAARRLKSVGLPTLTLNHELDEDDLLVELAAEAGAAELMEDLFEDADDGHLLYTTEYDDEDGEDCPGLNEIEDDEGLDLDIIPMMNDHDNPQRILQHRDFLRRRDESTDLRDLDLGHMKAADESIDDGDAEDDLLGPTIWDDDNEGW